MRRSVVLTAAEADVLRHLGQGLKRARLRRNLKQEDLAERAGVTRKTYQALESGKETASLSLLAKTLLILGYPSRLGDLLATDPIGEEMEETTGRKRAAHHDGVADF